MTERTSFCDRFDLLSSGAFYGAVILIVALMVLVHFYDRSTYIDCVETLARTHPSLSGVKQACSSGIDISIESTPAAPAASNAAAQPARPAETPH